MARAPRFNRLVHMSFFAIKSATAFVVLAASCVLILQVWNALTGWIAIAACAALVIAAIAAAWALARRLASPRNDRIIEHRSELSTLAFPPSSFRK